MSRVGKSPVILPAGVNVELKGDTVQVKGPNGTLERRFNSLVSFNVEPKAVVVAPANDSQEARAMWGTARAVLNNMVTGVTKGYTRELELQGVGYRASFDGKSILTLTLGYSHEIKYAIPAGIKIAVEKQTAISISGACKEMVGQIASEIRSFRKPEPYKGKGVRYKGEKIRMKEGKKK